MPGLVISVTNAITVYASPISPKSFGLQQPSQNKLAHHHDAFGDKRLQHYPNGSSCHHRAGTVTPS